MMLTAFGVSLAADDPTEWNKAWTQYQTVFVQETAGYDRSREPAEAEVKFFQSMPKKDVKGVDAAVKRAVRVVHKTVQGKWEEIPCQAYDVRPYDWNSKAKQPEIMVRARVAFFADVPAHQTGTYFILYGNPNAPEPNDTTGLTAMGKGVGYTIENPFFRIITDKTSGQIDKIDLKFSGNPSFRFVHGNMHWNPDFMFVPEDFPTTWFTWYYAHNFVDPPCQVESGPVFFSVRRSQLVPGQDIAWMEVYYRFYDGLPWFLMESRITTKKKCHTLAIRNDELAFSTDDFTHAGWRNYTTDMLPGHIGEIGSVDIFNEARMGDHVLGSALPPNIPWISFCNVKKGYAVGSIRLKWDNTNVLTNEPSPLYNSHTVISEHYGGLYWFRSLVYTQRDDNNTLGWTADDWRNACREIPEGSSYYEKNAYMFYEWTKEGKFKPIDEMWFKLREQLKVTVGR